MRPLHFKLTKAKEKDFFLLKLKIDAAKLHFH